jgi:hypothetical protein
MNRFKNYVLMAAGFAVLSVVMGAFAVGPAIAQAVRAALVSNVDDPGRIPYQSFGGCLFLDTHSCHSNFLPVKDGKRLVITQVSGYVEETLPSGTLILPQLSGGSSSSTSRITIPVAFQGNFGGQNFFVFNQPVTVFIDAGQVPFLNITLGGIPGQDSAAEFTVTGYLLDCSTGPCAAIEGIQLVGALAFRFGHAAGSFQVAP